MRKVRIMFTASPALISRAIRWLTKSHVSHAMIGYHSDDFENCWVIEATFTGVRMVPENKLKSPIVESYRCDFKCVDSLKTIAKEYVGEAYDYKNFSIYAWALIAWKFFKHKVRHPLRNTREQQCSEFVARFINEAKAEANSSWVNFDDPETVLPKKLSEFCSNHPAHFPPESRIGHSC